MIIDEKKLMKYIAHEEEDYIDFMRELLEKFEIKWKTFRRFKWENEKKILVKFTDGSIRSATCKDFGSNFMLSIDHSSLGFSKVYCEDSINGFSWMGKFI